MTDKPTITKPGIYDNLPNDVYHAQEALSASGIKKLLVEPFDGCPAKFRHDRDNPPEHKRNYDIGHMAHRLLLGRGEQIEMIDALHSKTGQIVTDYNTKAAQEQRDAAYAKGRVPALMKEFKEAQDRAQAVFDHPIAAQYFQGGVAERSLFWKDPETGIMCRCRPDYMLTDGRQDFPDYKTTDSAAPNRIKRILSDLGYWVQAAWYRQGLMALGLAENPQVKIVFQERKAPYLVTVATLPNSAIEWGDLVVRRARIIFAECQASGHWPGYAEDEVEIGLASYMEYRLEDALDRGAFEFSQTYHAPLSA